VGVKGSEKEIRKREQKMPRGLGVGVGPRVLEA